MDEHVFAEQFEERFRETYLRAVRRIADKRARLTPETVALLDHLAIGGPMTPGEMAKHLGRAPSTLSEMLDHLLGSGLLERDRDPADGRRSLIWLSDAGRDALARSRQVLEPAVLARAAAALSPEERQRFLATFDTLLHAMKGQPR